MAKNFSWKLALTNIKNNRKFYLPYFLASAGITGMFYIICFLAMNEGISTMSASLSMIMGLGVGVMAIFSFIFLFYTNSFLMKRRKKEIGLYNILGMEKRHIGRILVIEGMLISMSSFICGMFSGILFSKLVHLFLNWVFGAEPPFGIEISKDAIIYSAILFGALFVLTTLANQMSIRLAKPIELLHGGNVGEKEPKAKGALALVGFLCLGAGYYIAITTENPLKALMLFFVAVVLVVIGTYCLFTAGSIVILKALRKNKKFYYKSGNFTAVSGLIYRMKQNAVGLANICILSTMVLVMVSGTVSLFFGMNDTVDKMAPGDINIQECTAKINDDMGKLENAAKNRADSMGVKIENIRAYQFLPFVAIRSEENYIFERGTQENIKDMVSFAAMTEDSYTRLTGKKLGLTGNEVAMYTTLSDVSEDFKVGNIQFHLKEKVDGFLELAEIENGMTDVSYLILADDEVLQNLLTVVNGGYENSCYLYTHLNIYTDCDEQLNANYAQALREDDSELGLHYEMLRVATQEEETGDYVEMVGGFLFLGIFLGIVFTFAAALIIYYKQISEGYYDKEKFEIMQKVGMSKKEVKATIRKQVLMVFFVPLVMAGIHIAAAFKMITKLLLVFAMTNVGLFAICTLVTFLIFAGIYALVYMVTAREYYKIVG